MTKKIRKDMDFKDLSYKYQLLKDLVDHIPDVIYFKDRGGRLILVNQAHAKGLGLKPEEVIGKTDFDIFPKERAQKMMSDDLRVMATGKPIIDKIERATRPDGMDNYVSTTKIPRYNDKGKIIGLMGITRDITRRMQFEHLKKEKARIEKKLEVLEELNEIKSEFISAISHELRTPLAIVKQLVMLVFEETTGPVNDKQREALKRARDNIERLKNLIDELLDISRIERDKLRLHYSLVNINALIKDSSDFFKKLAEEKDISLKYYLPKEEINLFIDADRINQVLSNLINNAIKFTEEGGKIKVEAKVLETKIRIGIIDNGIGITKSDLPLVFHKFMQVSKMAAAEKKGVGLGLSIAKELVERHGGEIWVESKLGVGSKFYFTLSRFYAAGVLDKRIKERIDSLLDKGVAVHFINLLIVDYKEFEERTKIGPPKLFRDLQEIIDTTVKGVCGAKIKQLVLTDIQRGKCSIILPGITEKKATRVSDLFKDKIKNYLTKDIGEDVFIALGMLSYSQRVRAHTAKHIPARISIKEIYIGSEMRRFKRVPYKTNIEIFFPKNKTEVSQTVDISEGGVCLVSQRLLKTDSRIRIRLELHKNKEPIYAQTRVAWIKKLDRLPEEKFDKYKIGLEFINLENKYRKILCRELKL